MLLQANKVSKNFGGVPLFENLDLEISPGAKVGLVGMNGTGKTTLFQILTGEEGVDSGQVSRKKDLKIGCIEQKLSPVEKPVLDYIMATYTEITQLKHRLSELEAKMAAEPEDFEKVLLQYGKAQEDFEQAGGYTIEDQVISMLKGLGLESKLRTSVESLSGGERVRVELARVLVGEADLLLLDEPTNHLDLQGIQWLENYLTYTKKAFIVISHDRQFLDNVVTAILEIEDGTLHKYPGNYSRYRELKELELERLQKDYELQQKEILRLKKLIHQYRQWGNESDNEKFFRKAKELEKRLAKIQRIKKPVEVKGRVRQNLQESQRSGKEVLKVEELGMILGDKLLFSDSSFMVFRGERIAIMGENGCGKSTLLKLLIEELAPDEGSVTLGSSINIGYLPQQFAFDQPEITVVAYAKQLLGNEQKAREELARFGFYAADVSKRLKDLSGGEQVRLYLLKLFQKKINLLILDEPTNHLDIYAREEIEEILEKYHGTLLVVSHDRYFLKKNLTKCLLIHHQEIVKQEELNI